MFARPGAGTTETQRALVARERHKHKTNGAGWRTRYRARPTRPHAPRGAFCDENRRAARSEQSARPARQRPGGPGGRARRERGTKRTAAAPSASRREPTAAPGGARRLIPPFPHSGDYRQAAERPTGTRDAAGAARASRRASAASPASARSEHSGQAHARQSAPHGGAERSLGRSQSRFQLIPKGITLPHRKKTL